MEAIDNGCGVRKLEISARLPGVFGSVVEGRSIGTLDIARLTYPRILTAGATQPQQSNPPLGAAGADIASSIPCDSGTFLPMILDLLWNEVSMRKVCETKA